MTKTTKLEKAIELATNLHKGQYRKSGEEYITHPIAVMEILQKYGFNEELLISAVLHDVCEDTRVNNIEIKSLFGSRVGFILNALTKNQKPQRNTNSKNEFQKINSLSNSYKSFDEYINYRLYLYVNRLSVGIIAEPGIMIIKIADQIHNLSTMKAFSQEKKLRKIEELEVHFLPIYHTYKSKVTENDQKKFQLLLTELEQTVGSIKLSTTK
ncbi:MAG: bifunctional (p)ppGpp synthetase/guanosine-3',5'-bis(diphosphate) 3'-pyrophosphohydrolase [Candidatus Gracilibacteria bacterium]|nr:bifunctional (p)ppGpp synthetase/guanosine-3',5'-bis(diphosphate) 3'-pyrophosphohydrolase [Candidatus Gracilibacteria bacterium]